MAKTGTTSIQASLFRRRRDKRYHFVTLDSGFGNAMALLAFSKDPLKLLIFFCGVNPDEIETRRAAALAYFDRCLRRAKQIGRIPIISAEVISTFSPEELRGIRSYITSRGFHPKVICYLRPPLDYFESSFQQQIKIGHPDPWNKTRTNIACLHTRLNNVDDIFGGESVQFVYYDRDSFPHGCVVMDFCQRTGIDFCRKDVVRVNEGLNANAVKFLYATANYRMTQGKNLRSTMKLPDVVKWETLISLFKKTPGPALRFHSTFTSEYLEPLRSTWPELEQRLGRLLPMTLLSRRGNEGIRKESDMSCYDDAALDWLSKLCGFDFSQEKGEKTLAEAIGREIDNLPAIFAPMTTAKLISEVMQTRIRRNLKKVVHAF